METEMNRVKERERGRARDECSALLYSSGAGDHVREPSDFK